MSTTTKPAWQAFFDRIPSADDDEAAAKCKVLYDEWAKTYDQDITDPTQDYVAPANATNALLNASGNNIEGAVILDAGCGTGLSGIAVRSAGGPTTTIDGIDISTGMLEVAAKTGVYRKLEPADLSKSIAIPDGTYDAVVCVGTLTGGHVGPIPALKEFVRVSKSGGLVVATVKEIHWTSGGYEAEVNRLENEGLVDLKSTDSVPYRQGQGVTAKMLVMMKR